MMDNLDRFLERASERDGHFSGSLHKECDWLWVPEQDWKRMIVALKDAKKEFEKWSIYKNKAASMSAKQWIEKHNKIFSE